MTQREPTAMEIEQIVSETIELIRKTAVKRANRPGSAQISLQTIFAPNIPTALLEVVSRLSSQGYKVAYDTDLTTGIEVVFPIPAVKYYLAETELRAAQRVIDKLNALISAQVKDASQGAAEDILLTVNKTDRITNWMISNLGIAERVVAVMRGRGHAIAVDSYDVDNPDMGPISYRLKLSAHE